MVMDLISYANRFDQLDVPVYKHVNIKALYHLLIVA